MMEVLKDRPVIKLLLKNFTKASTEKTEKTPQEIRWPKELAEELDRLVRESKRIRERKEAKRKVSVVAGTRQED